MSRFCDSEERHILLIRESSSQGYDYFKARLHQAFQKNRHLEGEEVDKALEKGEYVYKGELRIKKKFQRRVCSGY